jgi:hypothetical protein
MGDIPKGSSRKSGVGCTVPGEGAGTSIEVSDIAKCCACMTTCCEGGGGDIREKEERERARKCMGVIMASLKSNAEFVECSQVELSSLWWALYVKTQSDGRRRSGR